MNKTERRFSLSTFGKMSQLNRTQREIERKLKDSMAANVPDSSRKSLSPRSSFLRLDQDEEEGSVFSQESLSSSMNEAWFPYGEDVKDNKEDDTAPFLIQRVSRTTGSLVYPEDTAPKVEKRLHIAGKPRQRNEECDTPKKVIFSRLRQASRTSEFEIPERDFR